MLIVLSPGGIFGVSILVGRLNTWASFRSSNIWTVLSKTYVVVLFTRCHNLKLRRFQIPQKTGVNKEQCDG